VVPPHEATRTNAAKSDSVSVPRWFIDEHLRYLHGAALRVYLALCGQQARVGRNRDFRYTLPEIVEATGLKVRAVSMALKDLDKCQLIERYEHPGRVGNRYRVVSGQPAATNGKPTPATTDKPVSGDTDVHELNPPEPEVVGAVAFETPLADQDGQTPLRDLDSSEPLPAELGDQGARGRENKEPEAQTAPDNTQLTPRKAEANPPLSPESILTSARPAEPLEPTVPAATADALHQRLVSSMPPSSSATLPDEIHRLASCIIGRPADPTMIQDLQKAADNDLELLRTVLKDIDNRPAGRPGTRDNELERWRAALVRNKKPPYDAAFRAMFCEEVYRRCQNLRSELKRKADRPANADQPVKHFRKLSKRERRRMKAAADNLKRPIA